MSDKWIAAVAVDAVDEDEVVGVIVEGQDLAIYNLEGEFYATANLCSHGRVRLSDGFIEDGAIECPIHQGKFCIKTGKALCAPLTTDIETYPLRIVGDQIEVQLG
ncbi:non-heme iron oxygenase ferredoxin subunit [Marinobacterium sp. LSUCC0821]|jgi:naphthalene 1,2-dioxygenase system ferredoxin subunit|uniref:non-heme iron oxygenase ferredoxin subunit n=1 Tax=Marinobacterium sp. LSUCC0821 TaxID=2668067 RepID=UPI00145134AF|nr:non-heme iron oxygenase ferredoxin subunit [Marinobacterium sp. LSUCC0821]QJD71439.1 non-heme iron oxygenase ferredoxin subunit [Marinobacterium sp. LSUCC0821]